MMTYNFYPVSKALYFDTSLLTFNRNQFQSAEFIEVPLIDFESVLKQENMMLPLINHVFINLIMLSEQYPNFGNWLERKVFTGLYDGTRSILLEWRDGKIAGLAILKNEIEEKKLCCLRIMPEFQNKGIGIKLFQRSFAELGTEKPLLSVSEQKLSEFEKIFNYFGFVQTEKYFDLYKQNTIEISYNGYLK
ncbi:GNAT family N-acetyltransferase [Neisseria subflava]|uniref:GNAT family N-acetyltransferase n=1 Tax=Neisseria subflava TaxID=28449 RepID=UPI000D30C837|nr:GNAT family N-acetyltransferase [Neisseria subflava]